MASQPLTLFPDTLIFRHEWRRLPWFVTGCLALALLAALPLLVANSVGIGTVDVPVHVNLQAGFYHNLTCGNWVPVWLDAPNAGFGVPAFDWVGRGGHYLFAVFTALANGSAWAGVKWGSLAAVALGGLLMYRLARLFVHTHWATLAAALHLAGPYGSFILYAKFGATETVGLALVPWVVRRQVLLGRQPSSWNLAWLVVALAVLVQTHLPVAFALGGLLVLLGLASGYRPDAGVRYDWRRPARTLAAVGLALAATAFYWPVLGFGDNVAQAHAAVRETVSSYIWYLFSREGWLIPQTAIPLVFLSVGGLGALVYAVPRLRKALPAELRRLWPALLVVTAGALLLQTPGCRWLWESTPLMIMLDRTHRLDAAIQVPIVLMLVGSGQVLLGRLVRTRWERLLAGGWVVAVTASVVLGALIPWYVFISAGRTVQSVSLEPAHYMSARFLATPTADITAVVRNEAKTDWKLRGKGVTDVLIQRWTPHDKQFTFNSPATCVELRQFDYVGWKFEIDGQPAPHRAGRPYGQITFVVEEGAHRGRLYLVGSPATRAGCCVSAGAGLIVLCLFLASPRFGRQPSPAGLRTRRPVPPHHRNRERRIQRKSGAPTIAVMTPMGRVAADSSRDTICPYHAGSSVVSQSQTIRNVDPARAEAGSTSR